MPRTTTTKNTTTTTSPASATNATASGASNTGPSAADRLGIALRRHPESTARQLAEIAGIGVSTAGKLLAVWAITDQAVRIPGDDAGGRTTAARWAPPEPADHEQTPTITQRAARAARKPKRDTESATTRPVTEAPPAGRLPQGALHGMCEDFLSEPDRRETAYTAGEIARKLVRSAGAVRNALDKLADNGTVALVHEQPRRYQIAETT